MEDNLNKQKKEEKLQKKMEDDLKKKMEDNLLNLGQTFPGIGSAL
jgi:predicted nuclease of restriction endonuclease-like (RecB) superfamily